MDLNWNLYLASLRKPAFAALVPGLETMVARRWQVLSVSVAAATAPLEQKWRATPVAAGCPLFEAEVISWPRKIDYGQIVETV